MYQSRKQPRLFFDCECLANPENLALMPDPKPPANLKDPAKIEAAIAEKKAEQIEMAALDPDYGKILSIGYAAGPDMPISVTLVGESVCVEWDPETGNEVSFRETTEADVLTEFWETFARCGGNCVGYNILSFDLPYLLRRSMYLGVQVPYFPVLARYRNEQVTDLMAILCNWDSYKAKSLKQMARLLGITPLCPDADGSKVKDMDRQELRTYQVSDVDLVQQLFKKMNGVYFSL